ncbi:hypothetical protein [Pectobacterium peruviense]|nr:hypothetical protein [Pectobacterium peruviense]
MLLHRDDARTAFFPAQTPAVAVSPVLARILLLSLRDSTTHGAEQPE